VAIVSPAQERQPSPDTATFKILATFDGSNGNYPQIGIVQGFDGSFYGTAVEGGMSGLSSGATTGFVTVTTPSGTLQSNVKFHVRP